MMRSILPHVSLLSTLLMCACAPEDFPVETNIDRLRVLGMTAEPADLHPGDAARLTSLVLDPKRSGQPTTFWIGCAPDPFNLNRSPCSDPSILGDPSGLGDMTSLPPGVKFIGLNSQATYSTSPNLFDSLEPADSRRIIGTVGQVIAISIAEEVSPLASREELQAIFRRVQNKEIRSLVSLFRVRISEDPERNRNPQISALLVNGISWPSGARVMMKPGQTVELDVEAPDESFERYSAPTPRGPEARTERILAAWYSTGGRFSEGRTALREGVKTSYFAPGTKAFDPVPDNRTSTLWAVLRDTRGGLVWSEFPLYFCEESLPPPEMNQVISPSARTDRLIVQGRRLSSILDVIVGGVALRRGQTDATGQAWEGEIPSSLPAGRQPIIVHTRGCGRLEWGFVEVP